MVLAQKHFFAHTESIVTLIETALFLHMGTFLAALVYFRKDVRILLGAACCFKDADKKSRKIVKFLFIATFISGALGICLLKFVAGLEVASDLTGRGLTGCIGLLLLITGALQIRSPHSGTRQASDLRLRDAILLGILQGFAALPGFSRSGLTVSGLLLSKFDKTLSLKLSFLMSLPIVLAGNLILNASHFMLTSQNFVGLLSSFVFGLLTIDVLLRFARAVNFGYFVIFFGCLTLVSAALFL